LSSITFRVNGDRSFRLLRVFQGALAKPQFCDAKNLVRNACRNGLKQNWARCIGLWQS